MAKPPLPLRIGALALAAIALATPLPLAAAGARSPEETLRIELDMAGRQRLLSQRVISAACLLSLGLDPSTQELALVEAHDIFAATLDQLEQGSPAMQLPPVSDPVVRSAITQARLAWAPVSTVIDEILAGDAGAERIGALAAAEPALLTASLNLVAALGATGAQDPTRAAEARALDMAARQRSLSQAVMKEACLITAAGIARINPAPHVTALNTRVTMFEDSAGTLRGGDPDLGIAPPPGPDAETALDTVQETWQDMRGMLNPALEGQPMDLDMLEDLARDYELLLPQLEDVVWFYVNR